jgi:hypothetical protein
MVYVVQTRIRNTIVLLIINFIFSVKLFKVNPALETRMVLAYISVCDSAGNQTCGIEVNKSKYTVYKTSLSTSHSKGYFAQSCLILIFSASNYYAGIKLAAPFMLISKLYIVVIAKL